MAKKIVKKTKLKLLPCLIVLLFFVALSFGIYYFVQLPIQNLIVEGTNYLKDDYILELAGVRDYPSFYLISTHNIEESKPLFVNNTNHTVVFSNKDEVDVSEEIDLFRIPRLINYVPDNKYHSFIQGMANIETDILGKISDIEYQPNDYDKDRFLLYMDDGNMVYLTLTKFNMINYYNDVLSQLENRKGILYLDNGNHFQIME